MIRDMMNYNTRPFVDLIFIIRKHWERDQHIGMMMRIRENISRVMRNGDRLSLCSIEKDGMVSTSKLQFIQDKQHLDCLINDHLQSDENHTPFQNDHSQIDIMFVISHELQLLRNDRYKYIDSSERDVHFFVMTDDIREIYQPIEKPKIPHFHMNFAFYNTCTTEQQSIFNYHNQNVVLSSCDSHLKIDTFLKSRLKYIKSVNTPIESDSIDERDVIEDDLSKDIVFQHDSNNHEPMIERKCMDKIKYLMDHAEINQDDFEHLMNLNHDFFFEDYPVRMYMDQIHDVEKKYFKKSLNNTTIIIDTNVFLDFETDYVFQKLSNYHIMIPCTVIKELSNQTIASSRRNSIMKQRALEYLLKIQNKNNVTISKSSENEMVLLKSKGLNKRNDNRIFIFSLMESKKNKVVLLTSDIALSSKCVTHGIQSMRFEDFIKNEE